MQFNKELLKQAFLKIYDELNRFLSIVLIIFFIIGLFVKNFYIHLTSLILFIIIIYRLLSKNKIQRTKENNIFLKIINKLTKPFEVLKKNIKDNTHVYRKCHKCKTILKLPLPNKKGFLYTRCPKCQNKFKILVLRKEKIEIIKKK